MLATVQTIPLNRSDCRPVMGEAAAASIRGEPLSQPRVVAVCASAGGIPKRPLTIATVTAAGIDGDRHAHEKHNQLQRAISLFDQEILEDLVAEGFPLEPGTAGENLAVEGLHVQSLPAGSLLKIGDVVLKLEQPRKPCYVLDAIDPRLKEVIVGRCGYMASVVREGRIRPGMTIEILDP